MTSAVVVFPKVRTVTIALGSATSSEVDLQGAQVVGVFTPSALTNATISFLGSVTSGGTFALCYDKGTVISTGVATNASRAIGFATESNALSVWRYVKIQTGTPTSPATEGAARTFYLVTK